MKISFIIRPFCDSCKINDYIDRLRKACTDEFQVIIRSNDIKDREDISDKIHVTIIEAEEEKYFFNAVRAARYEYLTVSSDDMSYVFFDDEPMKADIAAINFDDDQVPRFFCSEDEITGGLLCFESPLSRCLIKKNLAITVTVYGCLSDTVYEGLIATQLLSKAKKLSICRGMEISPFEVRPAKFEKIKVLQYADFVTQLLRTSDFGIRLYILCNILLPFFRSLPGGTPTRENYDFLCEIIEILGADEKSKELADLFAGYDVSLLTEYGYYGYCALSLSKAFNDIRSNTDNIKSETKKLMTRAKAVESRLQDTQKTVNACKSRLSDPDITTMPDNLFYLSETVAAVYDLCKRFTKIIEREVK